MKLRKHILLIVLLTIVKLASAQYTTAHYIAPSPWSYFSRYNELVVTTLSTTPVAVTIASSNGTIYSNSLTTVAGTPLRYRFSATNASYNASSTILTGQGLYVSASVPIGVQVRNIASDNYTYGGLGPGDLTSCVQKGNSAFTSLGDQGLGTSFRLGYYANVTGQTCYSGETGAPLYSVLAISNSTNIYVNGIFLKTLSAGQSYIFQASLGSILTSNNNVAVNSGMRGDNSSGCADGVESQVIPVSNLGTTYVVVRSNGNTGYEKSTIVATQASTTVTVKVPSTNTTNTYTLSNAGDYVTINNGDGVTAYTTSYITTTAPVAVYTGSADGCEIDMIVQPPLSSCSGSFDVQTSQFLSNTNDGNAVLPYFGYIVIQSDTAIVYFNGTNLESIVGSRTQIGTSGFYIIKYTSTQLGNPSNLRFVVNARINAALIESGAGYSMSAFISSISNAMPPPSASSSCLPTTFTAQGGFSSYQWYKDGVAVSGATSQTYSPAVAGSYSVTGTTANCGTTAQSTAVLVNPKPNAGSDAVSCAGKDVTLTATSTITGGSWLQQASNLTGATLSNTANNVSTATFSNTASGTYNFIFSVGCSDTMSVTINPLPTVAAITGTTSVCIGSTTTVADATIGGVWSSATTSVATINNSGVVTGVSAGTSVISYTVTNANGCITTVTTTVTVNALPTVATITGTTNVCVGKTTTLADATTGGVWSSATTSVATINSSGVVTGVSAGTSVISYTVTNANGCVTTVTTTVTVNALPTVAAITGTTSVCAGSTTTLADATTGGVWSSGTTSVATINSSGVVTGVSAGTSVISYTVTNANGCVTTVTTTVTVNALPTVAAITGTTSVCSGSTTTLSNITSGGVWSSGTTSVATVNTSGVVTGVSAGSSVITYTYINANGCSASTTKTITVNAQPVVAVITGTSSVCIGSGTITLANTTTGGTWSSSLTYVATISSSGVITSVAPGTTTINYTVNGSGGCSTTQSLAFTLKATSTSTTNASICSGTSYTFNGTTYSTAGTYTKTLTNAVGCDSIATLVLTVKATSASTTNASICSGTSYSFNGTTYSTAGTYVAHLTNAVGCDSAATLNLTVKAISTSTTNASICSGTSYTFNGTTYTTAGTYVAHLTNAVGCDSAATLNLTVKATSTSTTNASICAGASYMFNGTTYSTAGTYVAHLTNAVGCDSAATLNLTVKATSTSTTNASICAGASYMFNGTTYTTAGTYVAHLTNAVGCDSAVTLVLAIKATSTSTTNASICSGTTYTFNGTTYTTAGSYIAHLTNAVGCDSAATLNLTVKATSTSTTNISICPTSLPYAWNGLTFNAAGTQTAHLTNAVGCDSAATLNLTVKATSTSTTNASICAGASYMFNGTTYTTAGTYVAHLTNAVGCDSAVTLVLAIKATSTSTTNASICSGTTYTFNGTTYTTAGSYIAHLTNAVGCDSAATLNLAVKAISTSTTNASICSGTSYVFNGTNYTTAGTYVAHLTNAVGCDSTATLNLTVKATSTSTTNASICSGTSYTFNGNIYSTAGTYIAHLTNAVGCDSAATLVLTVKATSTSTTNISICLTSLPYVWNGLTFNAAGTQTAHLTNAVGCDSAATLNLTVKATSTSTTNASICAGASYMFNGTTYTTAGTYVTHLTNAVGCDSAATLNLTVKATSASTTNASICSSTSYTFNGTNYTTAGTYVAHLTNAVGCDSAATLVLAVKATSTSTTSASICAGTSYTFNGTTYSTAGSYIAHLTNAVGCDSAATLNLIVKATSTSTTNASICSSTTYTFNGTTYSIAGTYVAHLTNAVGCDSAATLNLTVKAKSTSTTNASICPTGLPYVWNGLTFNTAGTQTAHLTNAVGCDSVATLVLTVKATSTSTTNASICSGTTYSFNGTTYTTAGTYIAHLTNAVGCDSAATLNLTILYPSSSINSMSICPSALPFIWNGVTFTGAGTQTAHILNVAGCDSAATLILTVKAALTSTTNTTICGGNSYMFNGTAYTTSGTYVAYLASGLGCDSIATLNLTVAPKPNAGTDKIVGFNNGNASVTLSGIGSGVWIEQLGNTGTSTIVSPTNANTIVKNFSAVGMYNYIYVNGACTDTMKVAVNPNGNISSYVWVDTNEDGINNESSTNGINNVTVELYKDDGTGNFTLALTTVTATNNGMPGYYNFIIPETGNYKVKFPLVAQDGGLAPQNLSTNYSKTSVANPTTGFSPVVTINTNGSGSALNNTSIGAGYKYVAAPNCNMTATIGYNQLSQCVTNNQYNFTGNFTGGTAPFTYLWDLNDGTYANTNNVSHTYAAAGEHDVTFIVKDSRGCEAHASTVQIYIGAKPKASLDIYTHSGNGDGFTFVSTSTISGGWMNYAWDLGNGTTSTLVNPMTTYVPGTYTITFIATGNFGCSDTLTKVITVDSNNNYCSAPTAKFTVNTTSQCLVGNAFTFTNSSTGTPTNYTWNFGDGSAVVTTQNATYSYVSSGNYNVALTIANACGSNTVTKQITVNDLPSTPTIITGPSTVTVGSIMLLSNATTGGVWSSSNTAVATINSLGIVTGVSIGTTNITYSVSNSCGTSNVSLPITVTPIAAACTIPVANFSINNVTQCLAGNAFVFANNSTGTTLNYTWNFGDASGLVNAIAANHSYTVAGTYTVSLTASNNCGISTITKTVIVNTVPAQPIAITGVTAIVSGATSTLSSVTTGGAWSSSNTAVATINTNGLVTAIAAGNTVITYTVSNNCGTVSVTKTITVTAACVPTNSTTTASICVGSSYSFNGSSYSTAGTYTAHLTNAAGCDSAASLILIIKQPTTSTTTASICTGNSYSFNGSSYNTAGTYTAHLTNAAGCDSAATLVLTVNSLPIQPQAITGSTNLVVSASTTLSSVTTGGVWLSNNTAVATVNANGLVTAVSAGTAVITYTVSNGCSSASVTTNVTVTSVIIPCNVAANFTVNNLQQCVTNNQFVFTNTTTGGTAPFTYLWYLSDGTTAITKDVTKAFATYGEHDIALQVTDSKGCISDAASKHITIGAKPVANFTVLSNTGNGQSKTFISASTIATGSMNYAWDFGNGNTSTLVNPTVTFVQGSYTIKLVVSGIGTCKDSATQIIAEQGIASVSVYPNPVLNTVQVSFRAASTTVTTVRVMDLQGRILQTQTVMPASVGANVLATLDFSALQPGSYVIYISDVTNGFLATKTILKQ